MFQKSATVLLTGLFLILATACGAATTAAPSGGTVAAQTLEAMLTQVSGLAATSTSKPSATPETPAANPSPTTTEIPAVQTSTETPVTGLSTTSAPSLTNTPVSQATSTVSGNCNAAFFVGDVGPVVDNFKIKAGATFVKSWMVRNIGTCTWTRDYTLRFQYDYHMFGPSSVNFPEIIPPNQNLLIEVNLKAPSNPGTFQGQWYLFDPAGNRFGVGPDGKEPLIVQIVVVA